MSEEISSSGSYPEQSTIVVFADVHAEMNTEPLISDPVPSLKKQKMLLIETRPHVYEIISISKNSDLHKIEEEEEHKTPDTSDTETPDEWNDFSSPERSKEENLSDSQKKSKRIWDSEYDNSHSNRKMAKTGSDDIQDENSWQEASPVCYDENIKDNNDYRCSPLSDANECDMFDTIMSTPTYQKGKIMPKPKFSYQKKY